MMRDLYFRLSDNFIRPAILLHDNITNIVYTCMYDTGVIISVWCLSAEAFFKTFDYTDSGTTTVIRGIEGDGTLCKVYLINLNISGVLFCKIPVVIFERATNRCHFILSHTLFRDYDVLFKRGSLCISNIDKHVIVYSIKSSNNNYYDVLSQQEGFDRCPLCGGALSSDGICFNPICE